MWSHYGESRLPHQLGAGAELPEPSHLAAVEMFREAQEQLAQAHSLPIAIGLHDALERSLEDKLADLY